VVCPPLKACLFILSFIYFGVSVKNIAEFGLDELIFSLNPYKEGKNFE